MTSPTPEQPISDFDRAMTGAQYHDGLQDTDPELFARGQEIVRVALEIDKLIGESTISEEDASKLLIKLGLEFQDE